MIIQIDTKVVAKIVHKDHKGKVKPAITKVLNSFYKVEAEVLKELSKYD